VSATLLEKAPAKINLTLRVLGRRSDGYHEIESLVAFADFGDVLRLRTDAAEGLEITGPFGGKSGPIGENLVLKAVLGLRERVAGLRAGNFLLEKNIPVAAGLGGGSADAAAALRLVARVNAIALDDPRLMAAARTTGADVPVCLHPRARIMRGIGEQLSAPIDLPVLSALLVNPLVPLATRDVFSKFAGGGGGDNHSDVVPKEFNQLIELLEQHGNDRRDFTNLTRLTGRQTCPYVGVGTDMFRAVRRAKRSDSCSAETSGRASRLVGPACRDRLAPSACQWARPMQNATASSSADLISDGGTKASASVAIAP
jgi:4-diphosphocytidyl-2-C-methyl-D-erythritol kinase